MTAASSSYPPHRRPETTTGTSCPPPRPRQRGAADLVILAAQDFTANPVAPVHPPPGSRSASTATGHLTRPPGSRKRDRPTRELTAASEPCRLGPPRRSERALNGVRIAGPDTSRLGELLRRDGTHVVPEGPGRIVVRDRSQEQVLRAVARHRLVVSEVSPFGSSLEDIYLELTCDQIGEPA
jgi:hypothetical protein